MTKIRFAPAILSSVPPSTPVPLLPTSKARTQHASAFPTEVYERIIDFVATENWDPIHPSIWAEDIFRTLQACALTSRAWVPRAQRYLFRFLGASASPHDEQSLSRLYDLLERHAHLGTYARALSVRGDSGGLPPIHILPLKTPQALPRLQRLHIAHAALYLPPGARVGLRQFRALSTLHLRGVHFYTVQDLRHVIVALRGLTVLSIEWPTWAAHCALPPPVRVARCATRLEELLFTCTKESMRTQNMTWFWEWLTAAGVLERLEYVSLVNAMFLDGRTVDAVAAMLRAANRYVFDVGLSWALDVDPAPLYDALARCSQLEFLGFILPYHTRTIKQLTALLSKLRARCEPLNILLVRHVPSCVEPTPEDWAALDGVLQQRQWRYAKYVFLDRVTLPSEHQGEQGEGEQGKNTLGEDWTWGDVVSGDFARGEASEEDMREWEDTLRRVLPRTFKRGILRRSRLGDGYFQDVVKVA